MNYLTDPVVFKLNLYTEYDIAFNAIIKTGNQIGIVLKSNLSDGEIVFKRKRNLKKMQEMIKFIITIKQIDSDLFSLEASGNCSGGLFKKRIIMDKGFQQFQEILRTNLKCKIEELTNHIFIPDKEVIGYLAVDSLRYKWAITKSSCRYKKAYNYKDILSYELLEDGETITSGGLGGAVVGGLAFGAVGAIVGGITSGKKSESLCKSLAIKITTSNLQKPVEYINFIKKETKKESNTYKSHYKKAQECISILEIISKEASRNNDSSVSPDRLVSTFDHQTTFSQADEIRKFKELFDEGVISQEEFEMKKKQLLNL